MSTKQFHLDSVTVSANARLHLGFFDLNGELGRKFGSLGVALSEPVTRLTASKAHTLQAVSYTHLDVYKRQVLRVIWFGLNLK